MSGGVFFVGSGRVWGKWQIVIRKGLKAGILAYIWLTEGVNDSGIPKGLRVSVGRGRLGWLG